LEEYPFVFMPIRSVLAVDGRNSFIITVIQTYRGLCGMGFLCFGFFTIVFGDFNLFLLLFFKGYPDIAGTFYPFVTF